MKPTINKIHELKNEIANFIDALSVSADQQILNFSALPAESQNSATGLAIRQEIFEMINAQAELSLAFEHLKIIDLVPLLSKYQAYTA